MSLRAALRIGEVLALIALAGCALNFFEEREAWRDQSERACFQQKLVVPSYYQTPAREIDGRGSCGIEKPLRVNAFESGVVSVGGADVVLGCMMTYTMGKWITNAVQPAAQQRFGMPVTEILTMGTYACRSRNNRHGDKLSEHAFANAFDVAGFRLADGRTIRVKSDWRNGDPVTQAFLRQTFISACDYFTTVLGPGSNRLHEDHIHIDLAHHNASGTSHYCRPKLDMPPPTPPPVLDPETPMVSLPETPSLSTPAMTTQSAATARWDDNIASPAATDASSATVVAAPPPPVGAGDGDIRLPPATIPLSYAQ